MRTLTLSTGIVALLLGGAGTTSAQEDARALVEQAIKAMGSAEAVQQKLAMHMKIKVKSYSNGGREGISMEGEAWEFGKRSRREGQADHSGTKFTLTLVVNGDKAWAVANGQVHDYGKDAIAEQQISQYVDRVTGLAVLLAGKGFTLAPLADIKVKGQPAAGLKVSYKGRPDTSLYFDKETGLLVKYAYRSKRRDDNKEILHETILSDYREPDLASADEKLLHEAKIDTDGPDLVEFVRKQTPNKATLDRVRALISKLGDESFRVREQTSRDLVSAGPVAVLLLREATKNADREVARRARECMRQIGEQNGKTQIAAAVRLLALRRPKEAVEVLWNYLPAADSAVADEVQAALFTLARVDGTPDPILVQALQDKDPGRRTAAAAALGEDGGAYARQPGRRVIPRPFKIAHKRVSYWDSEGNSGNSESETSEYQFFNAFEDKLFAKP